MPILQPPPLPILRDSLSYSRWSICDRNSFLRLCRYRPGTFDEVADAQRIQHEQDKKKVQIIRDPVSSENQNEMLNENFLETTSPPFLDQSNKFLVNNF
ncbi:unnamed protein product, partial [Mesorhabditis belari]|uniref:Uncharacterized protein n=1 Tax=Mesorhabditis belari TaxID=2138241 RepID=A0AAF3EMI8_9BILA